VDVAVFSYLNTLAMHAPVLGRLAVAAGRDGILLYALLLLGLWVRPGRDALRGRRVVVLAVVAAALSLGVNAVLNAVMPRPRPFLVMPAYVLVPRPHDASFPSDHAAVAAAVGAILLLGGAALWGGLAAAGAVLIGVARVMIGVHYPSDIVGGLAVGALCAAATRVLRGVLGRPVDTVIEFAHRLRLG
jgi:undecaprenyl-diphosphatase